MPRKALTAAFVKSIRVEARTDFFDDIVRGLVLRVSPQGVKAWNYVYTGEAKTRVTIGRYPGIDLEAARGKALKLASQVAEGHDPAGTRRANRAAITFAELASEFMEKHSKRHKRSWAEDERMLGTDAFAKLNPKKAREITAREVRDIVEAKVEAGAPTSGNRHLALIRKLFSWAVDNDFVEVNPAAGIRPPSRPVHRDRVLSEDEIRAVWNALPGAALRPVTKDIFRLLLLTGQRSGEVAGMRRGEVDVDKATWTIPPERAKNGRRHVVPLSDAALAIVEGRLAVVDDAPDTPLLAFIDEPMASNAVAHAARKLQVTGEGWSPHDLRRSVATGMAEIGVLPHIVETVLNHVSGFRAGVAGVYNRAFYDAEKRRALDLWADRLDAIVTGRASNVRPFRRPA